MILGVGFDTTLTRRELLGTAAGTGLLMPWTAAASGALQVSQAEITPADLEAMEKVIGIAFSAEERKAALGEVQSFRRQYQAIREAKIGNEVPPCATFHPLPGRATVPTKGRLAWNRRDGIGRNQDEGHIAFATVEQLAAALRSGELTSLALTQLCLRRLKRYDPSLHSVVTLLERSALDAARQADRELAKGMDRGPLHGIPCGVKDLFSLRGAKTTWGAEPFRNQVIDEDAAVVDLLREAGAVICAKLSLGALAMDDKWFGGQTKNPWNPKEGSSGSSAGSACAVAAGLLPFAIGTETLGSIVSPSHRCRVVGLRPTFGRISRFGAMALSWSMDKVGPIARSPRDCALVLEALAGHDPRDPASSTRSFGFRNRTPQSLRVGILEGSVPLDEEDSGAAPWQSWLKSATVHTELIKLDPPQDAALLGLSVEAAAAFDDITRSGAVNEMTYSLWPNIFRQHRYVTAVEHLQSQRLRRLLQESFEDALGEFDVILAPDRGSHLLLTTNLTGHPQLYVPLGPDEKGRPLGVSLIGRLYEEDLLVALGDLIYRSSPMRHLRPNLEEFSAE